MHTNPPKPMHMNPRTRVPERTQTHLNLPPAPPNPFCNACNCFVSTFPRRESASCNAKCDAFIIFVPSDSEGRVLLSPPRRSRQPHLASIKMGQQRSGTNKEALSSFKGRRRKTQAKAERSRSPSDLLAFPPLETFALVGPRSRGGWLKPRKSSSASRDRRPFLPLEPSEEDGVQDQEELAGLALAPRTLFSSSDGFSTPVAERRPSGEEAFLAPPFAPRPRPSNEGPSNCEGGFSSPVPTGVEESPYLPSTPRPREGGRPPFFPFAPPPTAAAADDDVVPPLRSPRRRRRRRRMREVAAHLVPRDLFPPTTP